VMGLLASGVVIGKVGDIQENSPLTIHRKKGLPLKGTTSLGSQNNFRNPGGARSGRERTAQSQNVVGEGSGYRNGIAVKTGRALSIGEGKGGEGKCRGTAQNRRGSVWVHVTNRGGRGGKKKGTLDKGR